MELLIINNTRGAEWYNMILAQTLRPFFSKSETDTRLLRQNDTLKNKTKDSEILK